MSESFYSFIRVHLERSRHKNKCDWCSTRIPPRPCKRQRGVTGAMSSVRSPAPSTMNNLTSDIERLRVTVFTRAAALSPMVREVTIGPNSPRTKRDTFADTQSLVPPAEVAGEPHVKDRVSREDRIYLENARRYEAELADTSNAVFEKMLARMTEQHAEVAERHRLRLAQVAERKEAELRLRVHQMLKAWKYNDPAVVSELCRREDCGTRGSRTVENMNRIVVEQNEVAGRLAAIRDSHATVASTYRDMSEIVKSDADGKFIYDKYFKSLNNIISNMNHILELCGIDVATDKEVKVAQILAGNIVNIKNKALEDIDALKAEREFNEERDIIEKENELKLQRQKKELEMQEKEKNKQVQAADAIQTSQSVTKPTKRTKPMFYTSTNFEHYQDLKKFLENYEASYDDLISDKTQKNFCFDCRKAVNVPVNSLCSVSGHHIKDKYDKLSKLLRGERVPVMNTYVCATQHPQGLAYCTALLAKKMVNQGHLIVSSKPEAAFPIASVTIALWSQFPDLGKLIEANFQRDCPYLIPMFLPQQEGQSDQDFYKSLGYLYDDEGVVEKQDMFLKRMAGIFRLSCAIWISRPPRVMSGQNPHGLRHAWRWLASFVNLKPESQISATLLFEFFTICGHDCKKTYGKQFIKVIKSICMNYLPVLDKIDEGGPKTRLEVFLQNILKTGTIPPPSGVLPPNVW